MKVLMYFPERNPEWNTRYRNTRAALRSADLNTESADALGYQDPSDLRSLIGTPSCDGITTDGYMAFVLGGSFYHSGIEAILKACKAHVPIIVVTDASSRERAILRHAGADWCFHVDDSPEELVALLYRAHAIFRKDPDANMVVTGPLIIDRARRRVASVGSPDQFLHISKIPQAILLLLASRPEVVFRREEIDEHLVALGHDRDATARRIDSAMRHLKGQLTAQLGESVREIIGCHFGVGYYLKRL